MEENSVPRFTADTFIQQQLARRRSLGLYRSLRSGENLIDFCSNDYLGFTHHPALHKAVEEEWRRLEAQGISITGSGGSRLLAGNTAYAEQLEAEIAAYHGFESGLLYNSGYDANLGFFSCVPQRGDTILFDEHIHASVRDGVRLSTAQAHHFKHNDLEHLTQLIRKANGRVYVAVESIYSMDGLPAPLEELVTLCNSTGAHLVVDEAHAVGVYGERGEGWIAAKKMQRQVFAVLYTFGKGLGSHGALWAGTTLLREFLVNFSRPLIYSTALPAGQHAVLRCAYQLLPEVNDLRQQLQDNIRLFSETLSPEAAACCLAADGPIQSIIIPGNEAARDIANFIRKQGYDVRPILSPTVREGEERIRVCLHAFNSSEEITGLATAFSEQLSLRSVEQID